MLYAVVARPPVYGGRLARYDEAAPLAVPGVERVVEIEPPEIPSEFAPLGGVAVIARNTWAAMRGREALNVEWEDGPNADYSTDVFPRAARGGRAQAGQGRAPAGRR